MAKVFETGRVCFCALLLLTVGVLHANCRELRETELGSYEENAFKYDNDDGELQHLNARRLHASQKDLFGQVLVTASGNGDIDSVREALEKGAAVDFKAKGGFTPAIQAAAFGRLEVLKILLKNGANLKATTKLGFTPMIIAAQEGHLDVVKFLLKKGIDLEERTDSGATALYKAAEKNHENVVKYLIGEGAEVDAVFNKTGATPLIVAAEKGNVATMKLLLENGAEVDAKNQEGATALHKACAFAGFESVKLLMDEGADLNAQTEPDGETPLAFAAFFGNKEVVAELLAGGADKKIKDKNEKRADEDICRCMKIQKKGPCRCFSNEDEDDIEEIFEDHECDTTGNFLTTFRCLFRG